MSQMEPHPISFTFATDDPPFASSHSPLHRSHAKPSSPTRPTTSYAHASTPRPTRPSTPPPRSLDMPPARPRRNHANDSHDDPVSFFTSSSPIRETMLTRLGRASTFSYDANEMESNNMSDLSFSSHSRSMSGVYSPASHRHDNDDDDDNDRTLNFLQQHAMDEFLRAHLSGCPLAKEEKWRELVRVMKDSSHGGRGRRQRQRQHRGQRRSSSSRSASSTSRSSRGSSGRSWTNDEILGFIRIGGTPGGGDSIASGLTSPTSSPNGLAYGSFPAGFLASPEKPRRALNGGGSPRGNGFLTFKDCEASDCTTEETLPTFPSLPGRRETSLSESLPTFPSLGGGRRPSSSNEEEFVYSYSMEEESVRDTSSVSSNGGGTTGTDSSAISNEEEEEEKGGVFLDICRAARDSGTRTLSKETNSYPTTSNSTWDSLMMSSDYDDPSSFTDRSGGGEGNGNKSIVKNLIGQFETTIHRSESSSTDMEPGFFQRTNTQVMQSQKLTPSHRRVVSASNPSTPQEEESRQSQSFHKIYRKSRRENTLEEQVRNVLERQHAHTVRDEVEGDPHDSHTPEKFAYRPVHTQNSLPRRTKGESVPSAQDILAELRRSPTPSSLQSGISFNSGGSKSSLPRKISVAGGPKSPMRGVNYISPVENVSSPDRGGVRSPSPLALAPSRRDLPRPNRINRKTSSEPNAAVLLSDVGAVNDSISSNNVRVSLPVASAQTEVRDVFNEHRPRSRVFPCTSPLTIGSNDNRKSIDTTVKASEQKTLPTNHDTQDSNEKTSSSVMNQSSKPSRAGLPLSKRDIPSTSTPRRILPSVKEIAARLNGQMKSDASSSPSRFALMGNFTNKSSTTPNANKSIVSAGSKDRIDEIRASISKLKHNGVGGIGKATSTLVRNQETGRYVIRDVDDESFDDIMLTEMMRPKLPEESFVVDRQDDNDDDHDCKGKQNSNANGAKKAYIGDVNTLFKMPSLNSIDESVVSDGVVDEAVRAAIDEMSSTSTDDLLESNQLVSSPLVSEKKSVTPPQMKQAFNTRNVLNGPSSAIATDVDDFFVIAKSSNQWPSFRSPAKDNIQGPFIENAFDINPSTDKWVDDNSSFGCAQWDDSGSDEWRDEKNSSVVAHSHSLVKKNNSKVTNFPSPTSVMQGPNRKLLKDGKNRQPRKPEVVPNWNPFDL